jgi:hypothetical protein
MHTPALGTAAVPEVSDQAGYRSSGPSDVSAAGGESVPEPVDYAAMRNPSSNSSNSSQLSPGMSSFCQAAAAAAEHQQEQEDEAVCEVDLCSPEPLFQRLRLVRTCRAFVVCWWRRGRGGGQDEGS